MRWERPTGAELEGLSMPGAEGRLEAEEPYGKALMERPLRLLWRVDYSNKTVAEETGVECVR